MNFAIKKINKKVIIILNLILSVILISNLFIVNVLAGVHAYPLYDTDVYAGPSDTLYPKSGSVFAGEQVYVVFAEGDWAYISYNVTSGPNKGKEKGGYVKLSSINNTYDNKVSFTEKKEAKSKRDQDVYTGKGENHVPVGSISKNETVWVLMKAQVEVGVYKYFIEYKVNGTDQYKRGWVSLDALEAINTSSSLVSSKLINDGTYIIESVLASHQVIDVNDASGADSANVHLWTDVGGKNQMVNVKYHSDGYYTFTFLHSGKSLNVEGANSNSGANVIQYHSDGTVAEQWVIKSAGGNDYNIVSRVSGKYLDVSGGNTANGTNIQVWDSNGTDSQKWRFWSIDTSTSSDPSNDSKEIKLDVKDYKQYDKSWSDIYIGSKTIEEVGCLTVVYAISESYRTGNQEFTPISAKNQLSYSGNDMIWPSTYARKYRKDRIDQEGLNMIAGFIKAGKPVIIGADRSSGSSHFVLCYGLENANSGTIKSSDILIRDPNSSSRKKLSDFLGTYYIDVVLRTYD